VAKMIAMRVRNDGILDWLPGIDVKIPGRAVKPVRGDDNELFVRN